MNLAVLSLIFLVLAVAIGFVKDINVGVLGIIFAFALVLMGDLNVKILYSTFPSKIFITLLGTMYLFALLQHNGTLELLSKKLVALVGKRTYLIPIIVYVISYLLSAAGPGAISAQAVMIVFSVSLSVQMGIKPYMTSSLAVLGTVGGTVSPIALTGIIVGDLTANMGISNVANSLLYGITLTNFICAVIIYVIFKGYKLKPKDGNVVSAGDLPSFNRSQVLSLIGMTVLVVTVLGFKLDAGLVGFVVAVVLSLLGAVDEKMAFKLVPWSVLVLVSGMSILMDVTSEVGGIKVLTDILISMMSENSAPFILALTSGLTGWFSSGNGVVIPTFVPTVPTLVNSLGGNIPPMELIIAIVAGATVGGLSPFDSGGSMIVGTYAQETGIDEKEQQKMFIVFFGLAVLVVIVASLVGLFGGFRLFL